MFVDRCSSPDISKLPDREEPHVFEDHGYAGERSPNRRVQCEAYQEDIRVGLCSRRPKRVGYSLRLKKVKASRCEYGVRTFLRKSGGEGICSI